MESNQIHPDDDMYGSLEHYEACGQQFANFVEQAARLSGISDPKILELPCGYGRATRHLVRHFSSERIVVADIMPPAVHFCIEQFGVFGYEVIEPVHQFMNIPSEAFDVAAMGSLVTHLSEENATAVIQNFLKKLSARGVAVITTHGVRAHERLLSDNWFEVSKSDKEYLKTAYEDGRFGFVNYIPEHSFERKTADFIGKTYGLSLMPHSWMLDTVTKLGFKVIEYTAGGWDNHQDVFLIGR
jgi:cyclopropane fatty-acyl-phospholipid synthase-like methyltransferase